MSEDTPHQKDTILIVEDDEMIRSFIGDVLVLYNYQAIFAENGKQGIKQFSGNVDRISIVIMDIHLPDIEGMELADKIRELNPEQKIIITSGFIKDEYLSLTGSNCLALQKPFSIEELLQSIRQLLR